MCRIIIRPSVVRCPTSNVGKRCWSLGFAVIRLSLGLRPSFGSHSIVIQLFPAHYPLITDHCPLTTDHCCPLPTDHYPLSTAHCPPPTVHQTYLPNPMFLNLSEQGLVVNLEVLGSLTLVSFRFSYCFLYELLL